MISDSSPLILYGRINKLSLLIEVYGEVCIAPEVYQEVVVRGKEQGYPDAHHIGELTETQKIKVVPLTKMFEGEALRLQNIYSVLDFGEAETIALALQQKESEALIDEEMARQVARLFGITPRGSLRILLEAYSRGIITKEDVLDISRKLIGAGLRIGAEVWERFYQLLQQMERKQNSQNLYK